MNPEPDDLIATVSALTLSIRVIGGGMYSVQSKHTVSLTGCTAVGYSVYFNVFYKKFTKYSQEIMIPVLIRNGVADPAHIHEAIELTSQSLINKIKDIPGVSTHPGAWEAIVKAGRLAYAESYRYVYYVSVGKSDSEFSVPKGSWILAFGAIGIIASLFLGDIEEYMDDHIAVVIH
jgi:hypothetical protein